jgi:signal transduction histidine kinase
MHKRFQDLLIGEKLIFIITVTSATALLLAFAAFSVNNIVVFKEKQKSKLSILAQIIADNSQAAVSFNDPQTAEELLSALKAEKPIVAAAIYDLKGKIFARYENGDTPNVLKEAVSEKKVRYQKGYLHIYWPIILDEQNIGTVFLKSNIGELVQLIISYFLFGVFIILICIGAAFVMAARLQKSISGPITDLTHLAEDVSHDKNFSLRAVKKNNDELGQLVDRFNEMLSEIQKREEALVRSNDALTRSNRDLEQFAYVASHDLQEPLRMVISYVDLLADRWKNQEDSECKEYMGFVTEGARRSRQLIDDLLEYSRVRNEGKVIDVDLNQVLDKAIANVKFAIEESRAVVTRDALPTVTADAIKLTQVFQNLIANAIKFRKKEEAPKIHVSAKKGRNEWILGVSDNGIGIDPVYSDKIFVIFKRLHTREHYPGTGIGLAICKRIVEQHEGRIWVESKDGHGATFYFTIPTTSL